MHRLSSLALACRFRRLLIARATRPRKKTRLKGARDLAFGVRTQEPKVRLEQCRSQEPILFPKLRIDFTDFPYLHCLLSARGYSPVSPRRPAAVDRYALTRNSTDSRGHRLFARSSSLRIEAFHNLVSLCSRKR